MVAVVVVVEVGVSMKVWIVEILDDDDFTIPHSGSTTV